MAKEQIEASEDGAEWFTDEDGYQAFRLNGKTWYLVKDAAFLADQSERNIELWTGNGVLEKEKRALPGTRKLLNFVDLGALKAHAKTRPTKEKSTELVPIALMQEHAMQVQALNDRIALLTKDATNAVAEAAFQKERMKEAREENARKLQEAQEERDALKAELERIAAQEKSELEQRLADLEAKVQTTEPVVDITSKDETAEPKKPGFFARLRGA